MSKITDFPTFYKFIEKTLRGKKTYFLSLLLALYSVLKVFGVISVTGEQDLELLGLLGALMGISLRAGMELKK